jgi:DNA-binding HxlR family transcriptional regulator
MRLTSLSDMNCSIARTLDVVGEWWTPLILRDAFRGTRRFDDFQASLGMARSVLTARLRKLTDQGILERQEYSSHPPRYEYQLTEKGRALFPVIAALMEWGDTWAPNPAGPPIVFVHHTCGNVTRPVLTCPHCGGEVKPGNVHSEPGPGAGAPRNPREASGTSAASAAPTASAPA